MAKTSYLDERWYLDPDYSYVRKGAYVWILAGETQVLPGGSSIGPTAICQAPPSIAQRIVEDHNARLERREPRADAREDKDG